ncbi:MAG TPA: UDP-3-O-(3-hydroxymyristoyl)glucosamine N-acyltransferase [Bacteroidota bacterium]
MKLRDILVLLGAQCDGDENTEIQRVAKIEEAVTGDISFVANKKYVKFLSETKASAVIVGKNISRSSSINKNTVLVHVDDPYVSFLKVLIAFHPPKDPLPPGIHPTAIIPSSASIGTEVRVGAHVVLGDGCVIGNDARLCHGVVLGDEVSVGTHTILYPNVTVREGCRLGEGVIIHSGTTIGSDGFGFAPKGDGTYEKIPQVGVVVIEDNVEIGANCAIDRATMGETRIKKGTKLDNLIQVAHNVVIGENTVIAAQAGISGSTTIGSGAMIGGQVGITGHLEISNNIKMGAQSGIHRSIRESGGTYFGSPALPHREAMKVHGALVQLPDLRATVRELETKVQSLMLEIQALKKKK